MAGWNLFPVGAPGIQIQKSPSDVFYDLRFAFCAMRSALCVFM
jgi:hypothetical protein